MTSRVLACVVAACLAAGPLSSAAAGQAPPPAPKAAAVDLNTATVADLESLPGIGRRTAELIVDYRQKHGAFKKVEELMNVKGIGEKSFLRVKPLVTVSPAKPEKAGGAR